MSFAPSTSPDITEDLPYLISARAASQVAMQNGAKFAVSISGVSFLIAPEGKRSGYGTQAYTRMSVPISKNQFDTSKEAGEQTLDGYWIRSQVSWHKGAGVKFYEPGNDPDTQFRFESSLGVDVWTQGQLTLLKKANLEAALSTGQTAYVASAKSPTTGEDLLLYNANGILKRKGSSLTTYTTTGTTPIGQLAVAGSKLLFGYATGIGAVDIDGTTAAALWTGAATAPRPWWAKGRIIAARLNELHELTLAGGTWPTIPLYTHPDPLWNWTSVAEAPSAILAAGYSAGQGAIFRFSLIDASSGNTPKLSQAYQIAEFPPGEEVHSLKVYLGKYVGIGTSRGIRVGVLDSSGNLTYGQLVVTTDQPVRSLTARDSFLYGCVTSGLPDSTSGVVRISLQETIGNGLLFPWAWDMQTGVSGVATSIATFGTSDRIAVGVTGQGLYLQDPTAMVPSGYVVSGRVRFATIEPKTFHLIDVRSALGTGSISLSYLDPSSNSTFLARMDGASGEGIDIGFGSNVKWEYVQYRLDLTGNTVLRSVQMKALPSPKRSHMISYPLLCMDAETDPRGVKIGHTGWAWERVQTMEYLEGAHSVVTVQDHRTGETYPAVIDSLKFENLTPPSKTGENYGGYLWVTARKL